MSRLHYAIHSWRKQDLSYACKDIMIMNNTIIMKRELEIYF